MSDQPDNSLRAQIYSHMREKDTEELIAIWRENDRQAWTDDAFDAVRDILIERLGQLPEQETADAIAINEEVSEDFEYPTEGKLIWIADFSNSLSWVILIFSIIYSILKLVEQSTLYSSNVELSAGGILGSVIIPFLGQVDHILYAGFIFLVLQAVTEVIYLLMDIREIVQPEAIEGEVTT